MKILADSIRLPSIHEEPSAIRAIDWTTDSKFPTASDGRALRYLVGLR